MTYRVRDATRDDIPSVILIGEQFHKESRYSHMDFSYEKVAEQAVVALEIPNKEFFQVITYNDEVVGMLSATMDQTAFGIDAVAHDRMLGLAKEHRNKCFVALQKIIDNYHKWAREKGAKRIFLSTTTGVEPEKTAKLYETMGFHQVGTIHEA